MRVLQCNWAPYFREPLVGGGVSVYCRNLFDAFAADDHAADIEPTFLYAGFDYTTFPRPSRIREVPNTRHSGVPTFSLVNSPVPAPSLLSFDQPDHHLAHREVEAHFERFLHEHGPFDVVHFQNLEGLTASCLRVAGQSGARVVLTLHNYWSVCPEVQLWQYDAQPCTDYAEGRACAACLPAPVDVAAGLAYRRRRDGRDLVPGAPVPLDVRAAALGRRGLSRRQPSNRLLAPFATSDGPDPAAAGEPYRRRRHAIVDLVNQHADVVLAVSQRTADLHIAHGIDPTRVCVQPIGTTAADREPPPGSPRPRAPHERLRVVYLGESRRDKGFHFLLDELRRLPADALRNIELLVACRITDPAELRLAQAGQGRLLTLADQLGALRFQPGYAHADLPALLTGVHLGIVPPLWEDAMPQVVFELLACRVPVLCSARGGALEFVRHPSFVFDPGRDGDFQAKLLGVLRDPSLLADFWRAARLPKTMAEHVTELLAVYRGTA